MRLRAHSQPYSFLRFATVHVCFKLPWDQGFAGCNWIQILSRHRREAWRWHDSMWNTHTHTHTLTHTLTHRDPHTRTHTHIQVLFLCFQLHSSSIVYHLSLPPPLSPSLSLTLTLFSLSLSLSLSLLLPLPLPSSPPL